VQALAGSVTGHGKLVLLKPTRKRAGNSDAGCGTWAGQNNIMRFHKIAQLGRQAAMEKTGFSRTVLKALQGAGGKVTRGVTGVPVGQPIKALDLGRAIINPRYPGLDRPPGLSTEGFLKPLKPKGPLSIVPKGWNPPKPKSETPRVLDRTRQSTANALRLINKAVPIGTATAAAVGSANQIMYHQPASYAQQIGQLANLTSDEIEELTKSIQGSNALRLLPHSLSRNDPVARALWRETGREVYPGMQRSAAYRLREHPTRSAVIDTVRSLSPFGLALTGVQRSIADDMPTIHREDKRKFHGDLAQSAMSDPEGVENSPLLAQLTSQVSPDLRTKVIRGLTESANRQRQTWSDWPRKPPPLSPLSFGEAARQGLDTARQNMGQAGIEEKSYPAAAKALVNAAYGGPSKDPKREIELMKKLYGPGSSIQRGTVFGDYIHDKNDFYNLTGHRYGRLLDKEYRAPRDLAMKSSQNYHNLLRQLSELHPSHTPYTTTQNPGQRPFADEFWKAHEQGNPLLKYVGGDENLRASNWPMLSPTLRSVGGYADERSRRPHDPLGRLVLGSQGPLSGPLPDFAAGGGAFASRIENPLERVLDEVKEFANMPSWATDRDQYDQPWRSELASREGKTFKDPGLFPGSPLLYDPEYPLSSIRAYAELADKKRQQAMRIVTWIKAIKNQIEEDPSITTEQAKRLILNQLPKYMKWRVEDDRARGGAEQRYDERMKEMYEWIHREQTPAEEERIRAAVAERDREEERTRVARAFQPARE
jgi:hypothetical protein